MQNLCCCKCRQGGSDSDYESAIEMKKGINVRRRKPKGKVKTKLYKITLLGEHRFEAIRGREPEITDRCTSVTQGVDRVYLIVIFNVDIGDFFY